MNSIFAYHSIIIKLISAIFYLKGIGIASGLLKCGIVASLMYIHVFHWTAHYLLLNDCIINSVHNNRSDVC